jgi:DNA replication protein DnaC
MTRWTHEELIAQEIPKENWPIQPDGRLVKGRRLTRASMVRMEVPEAFWGITFKGVNEDIQDPVRRYLDTFRATSIHEKGLPNSMSLWIYGPEGTGKTAIAVLAAKRAMSYGSSVYFTSVWAYRQALRARAQFDSEESVLERCKSAEVLILDGLAEDDLADPIFGRAEILALMCYRASRDYVTIVTTALEDEDLVDDFVERVSRLLLLEVAGENRRIAESEELQSKMFGEKK